MHIPKQARLWPAILILSTTCAIVTAQADTLSLAQAEKLAIAHNPALAATAKRAEAMAQIPSQVGALPDPKISFKALNLPVDSFSTTQENMTQLQFGFSQALPFPGKLALKSEAAAFMAEAALHHQQEFRLILLRNTRIHWWNLAYLDRALSIIQRNQKLLRNLVKIADTKYKTGKGLQQDVLLAQLELSKLLEREMKLQAARVREAATLNALLGRAADTPVQIPALHRTDLEELTPHHQQLDTMHSEVSALKQWAHQHRPMLQAMQNRVQAADRMTELAQRDYYPDFTVGAAYGLRQGVNPASGKTRPDFASIMLSMSLPLYSDRKQDRALDQRRAETARAQFSLRDAINQVDAEIDRAASDLNIARKQVVLFDQGILPQARQTTASMLAGYQVNKVDFLNLVRAQLNEFNMDIQYWKQVSTLYQAKARLAAAAGKADLEQELTAHE